MLGDLSLPAKHGLVYNFFDPLPDTVISYSCV